MRSIIIAVLAAAPVAYASPTVFSVHDDLLAFPQYEVVFSDSYISDREASLIIDQASASSSKIVEPPQVSTTGIEAQNQRQWPAQDATAHYPFNPSSETYELMWLNNEKHLCIIPIVELPVRNETSEAEARAAEQKELARATDRGWELLQELEGNCLYFGSGWWSYSFCYNAEITQFHALPPHPGKPPFPPQRDPTTKQFVLGKAKAGKGKETKETKESTEDEWGHAIDVRKPTHSEPPNTELQIKGDTRYLVQRMEGGTTCDLTGKPRKVEVQYHCNPHVTDRIGYIKEITTCSYVLVIYTPRLCNDVAFMPPKENKANAITCRVIVPESDMADLTEIKRLDAEIAATEAPQERPVVVGGVILGGGKFHSSKGQRMPVPPNFADIHAGKTVEVIARGDSKAEGGKVEVVSDEDLAKLDLDPEMLEEVKRQVQEMAKEKGWKIEIVDAPGQIREILGIVDPDPDEEGEGGEDSEEGSEEIFKDEL